MWVSTPQFCGSKGFLFQRVLFRKTALQVPSSGRAHITLCRRGTTSKGFLGLSIQRELMRCDTTASLTSPPSFSQKVWEVVNSPIILLLLGTVAASAYLVVQHWVLAMTTPAEKIQKMEVLEQARTDAALIAPFLANLDASQPTKFEATRAVLFALERAADVGGDGEKKRILFAAVHEAIENTGEQIRPRTAKAAVTDAETKNSGEPISHAVHDSGRNPRESTDIAAAYELLESATLVYIQVEKEVKDKQYLADRIRQNLRENMIIAPAVEKIDHEKMPTKTQVRYFNDSDKVKAIALAAIVGSNNKLDVSIAKPNRTAKEGTLELWIGRE